MFVYHIMLILLSAPTCLKSHFRGGTITWGPGYAPSQIEISYRLSWRRSFSSNHFCNNSDIAANILRHGEGSIVCTQGCNGTVTQLEYHCVDFSETEDWTTGSRTFLYNLTTTSPTIAFRFNGCCWIPLQMRGYFEWSMKSKGSVVTRFDTGTINHSPITSMSPIVRVAYGCNATIDLGVSDADGDVVRCRWSKESDECGSICLSFPGAFLNEDTCTISYQATKEVGYYSVAVQVEDFPVIGGDVPLSSIPLQFLVDVYSTNKGCGFNGPEFIAPTRIDQEIVYITADRMYFDLIVAISNVPNTSIVEIATISPHGFMKSALAEYREVSGAWYVNISWTPSTSDENMMHIICFEATDKNGINSEQRCVNLIVSPGNIIHVSNETRFQYGLSYRDDMIRVSDNKCILVSKEFLFPVFLSTHSRIYVCVTGIVTMDEPFESPGTDDGSNMKGRTILAPYFTDIDTESLRYGGNVYYHVYNLLKEDINDNFNIQTAEKLIRNIHRDVETFKASFALFVTWHQVLPYPARMRQNETMNFQLALVTDGVYTFAFYVYMKDGIKLRHNDVFVGFTVKGGQRYCDYRSFSRDVHNMDSQGSYGYLGLLLYRLTFLFPGPNNSRQKCINWYLKESENKEVYKHSMERMPLCPCNPFQLRQDMFYNDNNYFHQGEALCTYIRPNWQFLLQDSGKTCCYDKLQRYFLGYGADAGGFIRYHPYKHELEHQSYDIGMRNVCCVENDLCSLYHSVRPVGECYNIFPAWHDPSKPNVTFIPESIRNIQVMIEKGDGQATAYKIIGTQITGGNESIQNGTFLSNETSITHNFTTSHLPGTCFNFRIIVISGAREGVGRSEAIIRNDICYDPSKPNATFIPESIRNIQVMMTKGDGQATAYEIIGTPDTGGNESIQNGTFRSNETSIKHNFTTSDLPGTCFNFRIIAISGAGEGAGRSEAIIRNDICYDPSKPNVTFIPESMRNIQVMITKGDGQANAYEIIGTPDTGGNKSIQSGKFLSSETSITHNFTTSDLPGTCFNFRIIAISGAGEGAGRSEAIIRNDICYDPSKPNVTFIPESIRNIQVMMTKGDGHANAYEIIGTPVTGGNKSIQSGKFLSSETSITHNFTTSDLPGTCFNFRIIVISGAGEGAGSSEAIIRNGICYDPSKPNATFIPESIRNIQVIMTKGDGQATAYDIIGTPVTGGNESIQNGTYRWNETSITHNFTTPDLPGTCFNFRIIAISGAGEGAGRSEAIIRNDTCYDPSKPNVTFIPESIRNIQVMITKSYGHATAYEISGTPVTGGNKSIQSGKFLSSETLITHNFTTSDLPGTCFNFRIIVISGAGEGAGSSEAIIRNGICYDPSKPNATFIPESIRNIQVIMTKGDGQATAYDIIGTPVTGGNESIQNGTYRWNETSITHNFTTPDLPGTCFNFRIIAISGAGEGAGRSEAIIRNDTCYDPSKPNVTFIPESIRNIQVMITKGDGQATAYEIIGTPVTRGNKSIQSGKFLSSETSITHNFTTSDLPGTCFNFRIIVISGAGEGAGSSEAIIRNGICYDPSKPNATFIPESIRNIQVIMTKGDGQATAYDIIGTPVTGGNESIQNGTYRWNETSITHNFTTPDLPGTCFNFRIIAISGAGEGAGRSEAIIRNDICYDPSKPNVTFIPESIRNIQVMITKGDGQATAYEIIGTPVTRGNKSIQSGKFLSSETSITHNFTTSDLPGTCFNFRIIAISDAGEGAGRSEAIIRNDICYDPSKPNVTFIPESIRNIQVMITKSYGHATAYEISGTPVTGGNKSIQSGKFLSSETSITHNFTTSDLPGTCFNFRIIVISGAGEGAGSSEAIIRNGICYDPSKPNVTFIPESIRNIQVMITKGDGQATAYEIIGTPVTGGNKSIQSGKFLSSETSITHNFTTSDLPGTCFNFRIIAISGAGEGAGRSEAIIRNDICYDPSKPDVTLIPESIRSIQVIIIKRDGQANAYEIIGTPVTGGNELIQSGAFLSNDSEITHNFTTSDLPGTCFNVRIIAISGAGEGAGRSEAIIKNDICYVTGPISRPVVEAEIQRLTTGENQLVFYCDIAPSSDPTVQYTVMWYRDRIDVESLLMISAQIRYSSRKNFRSFTFLSESNISLGIKVFCTVSATKVDITVPSEPYFAGIEIISDDDVSIQDSEEAVLYIRSAIPFGCLDLNKECFLNVNMLYSETGADNCLFPAAAAFSYCGVRISSRRWNETYPLRIGVRHGQDLHSISRTYNIKFKTDENFEYHKMFRNYTISAEIQVKVSTDTSNLNGKECHAICDPHMLSFDGRYYENQNQGTYILYKHAKKPVQVQMKTNLCYGILQGPPFCPCGVAIAAGRDVFVIDRCSIPIKIYMPKCDDETLKGKIKTDGKSYQIYLPTGSLVKIASGVSFNVYLYPSVSDRMATSGLCGYLDNDINNDFTLRNGSRVPEKEFEAFNSNWEVKPEEDLFNPSNYKFLPIWQREDDLCICDLYQDVHTGQSDNCSPDSRKFCHDSSLNDSLAAECNTHLNNEPVAAVELDQIRFNVSRGEMYTVMGNQTMRNYTENRASLECWSFLNSSLLFKKCSEIPDIDPSSFANMCAKDAMITSTMNWASTHLDSAQKSCLYQVIVNQPLPTELLEEFNVTRTQNTTVQSSNMTVERTSVYTSDLVQEVKQMACPMDCSGHGNCIKGKCYCEDVFGEVDCSVDLRVPPVVYGIPERGVCDLQRKACERVHVLGNNFVESEQLSCRLSCYKIKLNGTRIHYNNYTIVKGERISFAEVSCPIADVTSVRSVQFYEELDTVAVGYAVAVGNNWNNFSLDTSLLLYDSVCVDCMKAGFNITCKIKEGFDLENLRCVQKYIPSKPTPTETGSIQGLIIAVAVGSALVLLIGLILLSCLIQRKKRNKYKKEKIQKAYQELQEMKRKTEYYGTVEMYDQIADIPDTYTTIQDNSFRPKESTDNEESYLKFKIAKNAETKGYSSLSKVVQDECNSDYEKPDIPARDYSAGNRKFLIPRVKIVTNAKPI